MSGNGKRSLTPIASSASSRFQRRAPVGGASIPYTIWANFKVLSNSARLSFGFAVSIEGLRSSLPPGIERLSAVAKEQAAQPPGRPVAAGSWALLAQPSAGARRSRRERLYPVSARPAKPMPSIAQVDGSGTAANSKSLEPVVNTTLPYVLRRHERHEETGVLRIVDVAEVRIEVGSEHLTDKRACPVRASIERYGVGRRRDCCRWASPRRWSKRCPAR